MHEMSLALQIIDVASEHAAGQRVRRVIVEVGALCAVLPDALQFSFEVAVLDTPLAGAVLCIEPVDGRAHCDTCDREVAMTSVMGVCECGNPALRFISGDQLRIRELEVE